MPLEAGTKEMLFLCCEICVNSCCTASDLLLLFLFINFVGSNLFLTSSTLKLSFIAYCIWLTLYIYCSTASEEGLKTQNYTFPLLGTPPPAAAATSTAYPLLLPLSVSSAFVALASQK